MPNHFVSTKEKNQVIDLTDLVNDEITMSGKTEGVCTVFVTHTTAAVSVTDLDPGTDLDLLDALGAMFPKLHYRHPHDPSHVGDHIMSTLIGQSTTIPFEKNALILGTWQRVVLIELNGPRERRIFIKLHD